MCAATADDRAFGPRPPLDPGQARRIAHDAGARAAVLVEGWSDQAAVETLARRRGCDLAAERIVVLPIGGITNLPSFIQVLNAEQGSSSPGLRLAGLCDLAEEAYVAFFLSARRARP